MVVVDLLVGMVVGVVLGWLSVWCWGGCPCGVGVVVGVMLRQGRYDDGFYGEWCWVLECVSDAVVG